MARFGRPIYQTIVAMLRPVFRVPFPRRWAVFWQLVNHPRWSRYWDGAPLKWTRCKNTGLQIPCDLSVFSGRIAWFFGRWYEIDTASAIRTLLSPGETFVDIGANVGMASLSAEAVLGPRGRIVAFEPNPAVAGVYAETVRRNDLGNVCHLHLAALGAQDGKMPLFIPSTNHGEASLATGFAEREGRVVSVQVTTGKELDILDQVDLIKIDVEGFELVVLQAIAPILRKFSPPVIVERMDEHLRRAGSSSAALDSFMTDLGYTGFQLVKDDDGLLRQRAKLVPLGRNDGHADGNALWLNSNDVQRISNTVFTSLYK